MKDKSFTLLWKGRVIGMNSRSKIISFSGILIFILSIFLFIIIPDKRTANMWVEFLFILLAEIILFGGLVFLEYMTEQTSQIILRAGGGFTLVTYAAISIIISILYMNAKEATIRSFLAIQFILLVLALIVMIVFLYAARTVKVKSDGTLQDINRISGMIDKLNMLKSDSRNQQYEKLFNKATEDLRFSDISVTVPADDDLEKKIVELEFALLKEDKDKENAVSDLLKEILIIINRRKTETKRTKKGSC